MAVLKNDLGATIVEEKFTVVKKAGLKGELIPKHNHPEAKVTFTVVKGKVQVFINETEEFIAEPGKILFFDGDNFINAKLLEDSEIFIHLVLK